jgi:methylmalonyl-CoA/ethylmalonyl-CoA epimerase
MFLGTFHHLGIACTDLSAEAEHWRSIGYREEGERFVDPGLGIQGLFMAGSGPRVELVAPAGEFSQVLTPWLERGIKIYHFAYEVDSLQRSLQHLESKGARTVVKPTPAVAFAGRQVAFSLMRNLVLIEFIQRQHGEH